MPKIKQESSASTRSRSAAAGSPGTQVIQRASLLMRLLAPRHPGGVRRAGMGQRAFELGLAAAPRFNLPDMFRPSLHRIAEKTGDTVFLTARSGNDSVCIDRKEGSFPIKTFTLEVGARRPLGAGAGGPAALMLLPGQAGGRTRRADAG